MAADMTDETIAQYMERIEKMSIKEIQKEIKMNGIHLCERCKYCTHSPNLFQPYYWCSWYGKEVKTPINRCDKITLKTV